MPYFLLIIGLVLLFCGGYSLKKENIVKKEEFKELLDTQTDDNREYIKLLAINQDIKTRLNSVETKLDHFLAEAETIYNNQINYPDSNTDAVDSTEQIKSEELPVEDEDMETSLNMGKGEVKFIQNLLEK